MTKYRVKKFIAGALASTMILSSPVQMAFTSYAEEATEAEAQVAEAVVDETGDGSHDVRDLWEPIPGDVDVVTLPDDLPASEDNTPEATDEGASEPEQKSNPANAGGEDNGSSDDVVANEDDDVKDDPSNDVSEETSDGAMAEGAEEDTTDAETTEPVDERPEEDSDETIYYDAESDGITVRASAKSGVLPEGSELRVSRLWGDSLSDAGRTLDDHGAEYDGYIAVDVSFIKDGENVEPDGDVSVSFDVRDVVPADAETVEVKHFDESDGFDVVTVADTGSVSDGDVSVDGNTTTAEFEVSSFSTFTIVWQQEGGWPTQTYLTVSCKDQRGNLLTDSFVPDLVVLDNATSYKFEFSSDNEKLKIDGVTSGTTTTTYTFVSAQAMIDGAQELSDVKSIEASYSRSAAKWTYTVKYIENDQEKEIRDLTADQISLSLTYSNEDVAVYFSLNGGSGTTPDTQKGKGGTKIVLPTAEEYGITRNGYTFLGWSEVSNLKGDTTYHEILKAGDECYLPSSGAKTLYAAWTSTTYGNANFYIRLDGNVAPEPDQYGNAAYTSGVYISQTVKEQRWMIDMDASNHDGVNVENAISANMATMPTAEQLKTVINAKASTVGFTVDVNDDGKLCVASLYNANNEIGAAEGDLLYVHWYVQKWANSGGTFWNVDGVLLTEKSIEITYHGNPNGTDISNLPAGYQISPGTDVTVGVSGAPEADSSHSLLYTAKTNYELVGWNTEPDGTGTTYKVGDVFRPTKDTTLYAMWSRIPRGSLKITKQVTGDMSYASPDTDYHIRVLINAGWVNGAESATKYSSVTDTTGTSLGSNVFTTEVDGWKAFDVTLRDGQSVILSGLYDNTIFRIEETDSTGYEVSFDGYDTANEENNRIETDVTKNVVIRNGMTVVETGVDVSVTPFVVMFAVVLTVAAMYVFWKRKLEGWYTY